MTISPGTRSLLWGTHNPVLHGWCLFAAWRRLYGFPYDVRLWLAFLVHDVGYWGMPNINGPEGETHPSSGGDLMTRWFGEEWGLFTWCHSRHYAARIGMAGRESQLCAADKLAITVLPAWCYLLIATASREIAEYVPEWQRYMRENTERDYPEAHGYRRLPFFPVAYQDFYAWCSAHYRRWAMEHRAACHPVEDYRYQQALIRPPNVPREPIKIRRSRA